MFDYEEYMHNRKDSQLNDYVYNEIATQLISSSAENKTLVNLLTHTAFVIMYYEPTSDVILGNEICHAILNVFSRMNYKVEIIKTQNKNYPYLVYNQDGNAAISDDLYKNIVKGVKEHLLNKDLFIFKSEEKEQAKKQTTHIFFATTDGTDIYY